MNKTRGAALVVSLVLLTVLTLLAVATMRTATLDLVRAGNAQTMAQAFEAAQAGLAIAVARINDNALALVATDGWRHDDAVTGTVGDTDQAFAVDLKFLYRGDPPPGLGPEPALYFELESTGRTRAAARCWTKFLTCSAS